MCARACVRVCMSVVLFLGEPGPEDGQRAGVVRGRVRVFVLAAERVRAQQNRQLQLHRLLKTLWLDYELEL